MHELGSWWAMSAHVKGSAYNGESKILSDGVISVQRRRSLQWGHIFESGAARAEPWPSLWQQFWIRTRTERSQQCAESRPGLLLEPAHAMDPPQCHSVCVMLPSVPCRRAP